MASTADLNLMEELRPKAVCSVLRTSVVQIKLPYLQNAPEKLFGTAWQNFGYLRFLNP